MRAPLLVLALLAACGKSGEGDGPRGTLEAAGEVRFGETPLLGRADARLVLKNAGKGRLVLELSTRAPFSVEPARVEVAPGRHVLATVHFAPTFEGEVLRTLSIAHEGSGPRQVLLVGEGRCACDDRDARTQDSCGDLGACVHQPIECHETPPPCWKLDPSPELGSCNIVPEPDGTGCLPSEGLCGGGGACREGACVLRPPREVTPAWSVPIGRGPVLSSPGGDLFALGRAGELVRASSTGASAVLARDLPQGAELVLLQGERLLLRAGLALEGRDLAGELEFRGELPGTGTEPWRFAASGDGILAVGGIREPEPCLGTETILVPVSPASGPQDPLSFEGYAPTGIVIDQDGVLRVSGVGCSGTSHVLIAFQSGAIWISGDSDRRALAAEGAWVFGPSLQLGAGGGLVPLPASEPFDPGARTLEPLASSEGGWVFDCTGETCDAPAIATAFQPGASGAGWHFRVGARPSGILLEGGELLVASEREGGAALLHARSSGTSEVCDVPERIEAVVTLAGGQLVAVTQDAAGDRWLAGFRAPGLAPSPTGWIVQGGTPGRSRRPIDLP